MNKKDGLFFSLGLATILLLWLVSSIVIDNSIILPNIIDVIKSLVRILTTKRTYLIIFNTISRLFLTIIFAFVLAIIFAVLSYSSRKIEQFVKPMFVIMKTLPVASIIIILLVIVGNQLSPYLITGFVVLPLMYEAIATSFKNIDKNIIDEVKLVSGINFQVIYYVFIPIVFPYILSALIQSIGLGLKVMVMAEFIAQPKDTIGYIMQEQRIYLNTDNIFAWTIILIIFVMIVEILIKKINPKNL